VYDLKSYRRSQGPMFILGTDTGLAIMLGIISAVLAAAALSILWARSRDSSAASPKKEGRGKSL
jgi:hypothetical protein